MSKRVDMHVHASRVNSLLEIPTIAWNRTMISHMTSMGASKSYSPHIYQLFTAQKPTATIESPSSVVFVHHTTAKNGEFVLQYYT